MPGFYGHRYVLADLKKHLRTGKVVEATLTLNDDSATQVEWTYTYIWPETESSALGGPGAASVSTRITAWRTGETEKPRADDKWTIDSVDFLINAVTTRLNADEAQNFAVYDCDCSRTS